MQHNQNTDKFLIILFANRPIAVTPLNIIQYQCWADKSLHQQAPGGSSAVSIQSSLSRTTFQFC